MASCCSFPNHSEEGGKTEGTEKQLFFSAESKGQGEESRKRTTVRIAAK